MLAIEELQKIIKLTDLPERYSRFMDWCDTYIIQLSCETVVSTETLSASVIDQVEWNREKGFSELAQGIKKDKRLVRETRSASRTREYTKSTVFVLKYK